MATRAGPKEAGATRQIQEKEESPGSRRGQKEVGKEASRSVKEKTRAEWTKVVLGSEEAQQAEDSYLQAQEGLKQVLKSQVKKGEGEDGEKEKPKKRPKEQYLKPLEGPVKRARFLVFDIESKAGDTQIPGFTRPFMCGFFDGEKFFGFRNLPSANELPWEGRHTAKGGCVDRFLSLLFNRRNTYIDTAIYAHNGGNFDFLFLLAWLRARPQFDFAIVPIQSTIQVLKVWRRGKKKEGEWTFLDSLKLLPMSLAAACIALGVEGKKDLPLKTHEDSPLWEEYNERDNRALYEVLVRTHDLVEDKLGGEVGITTPSTAMRLFRRKYLGNGSAPMIIPRHLHWKACKDDECPGCLHSWVRDGYYGGRTEIHRMKGKNLKYYDLNSSYPASMMFTMPAGNKIESDTYEPERYFKNYVGFVECTVYIPPECEIPPLPFRAESGKLLFPSGMFAGTWSAEELELLKHPRVKGHVVSVVKCVWYRRVSVFVDMVTDLYKYRDKSLPGYDSGLSTLAKLILNALYGKFGMKEEREQIILVEEGESPPQNSKPAGGDIATGVWYETKIKSPCYVIPQIAAHITALARVRLWHVMNAVLEAGGKIYYCDTDSVITDVELPTGSELGALKDEYPGEPLDMEFFQPKVYTVQKGIPFAKVHTIKCLDPAGSTDSDGEPMPDPACKGCSKMKVTMKGLPARKRTPANMLHLLTGGCDEHSKKAPARAGVKPCEKCGVVEFERLEKIRSLARKGFWTSPEMVGVKKRIVSEYDKRIRLPDGGTSPIVLGMGA
jgi:hypothetical protein